MKVALFILSLLFFSQPFAEENSIEYKIKAGYIYNFTKFITWPNNDSNSFNICILGHDPFGEIIDPIEKRDVKSKPIRLFRIKTINDIDHCHIVYASDQTNIELAKLGILTISSTNPKLTVGETTEFIHKGGMISFFQYKGKVKLRINLKRLRQSGLEISAKLIEVADIYEGTSND